MNKTLKKLIALMLVLVMALPVFSAAFAVFAEEAPAATTAVADDEEEKEHADTTFFEMFIDFFKSIWSFIKYVFYEVFLGKPAPKPPEAPTKYFNA